MNLFLRHLIIFPFLFLSGHAQASQPQHVGEVKLGGAIWNLMDEADRNAVHGAFIYRPLSSFYNIQPSALIIWADEGQHYFAIGAHKGLYRQGKFSLSVAFHAGLVDSPEELGDNVEFYTALGAQYQLTRNWSAEVELGHISNGGLGENNPGSEGLTLSVRYVL